MAQIHGLRYELLLNSPDLIPSDFYLFPRLKIFLGGTIFSTTEERTAEVEGYFAGLEESHFRDEIKTLEHRWTNCISLQRVYVENKNSSSEVRHFFLVHYKNISNHPLFIIRTYTVNSRPSTPKRQICLSSAITSSMFLLLRKSITWFSSYPAVSTGKSYLAF